MWCSCEAFTNIWQQQLYKSPIWFWQKKFKKIKGLYFIFKEVKNWEYLCFLEAVYMAPIATDPGTGSPLCTLDGVQSHCLWKSMAQAALIVSNQGEAAAPERLRKQGFPAPNRIGLLCVRALGKFLSTTVWVHLTGGCHCFHSPIQNKSF